MTVSPFTRIIDALDSIDRDPNLVFVPSEGTTALDFIPINLELGRKTVKVLNASQISPADTEAVFVNTQDTDVVIIHVDENTDIVPLTAAFDLLANRGYYPIDSENPASVTMLRVGVGVLVVNTATPEILSIINSLFGLNKATVHSA